MKTKNKYSIRFLKYFFLLSILFTNGKLIATENYPDCTPPENLSAVYDGETEIQVNWEGKVPKSKSHFYKLRYKPLNNNSWTYIEENRKVELTINGIDKYSGYQIEVQKVCYGNKLERDFESKWIGIDLAPFESRNNTNDSLCALLTFYEAQAFESGIMVNWEGPMGPNVNAIYEIGHKKTGHANWTFVQALDVDHYYIPNLQNEELYDVSIRLVSVYEITLECQTFYMGPILVTQPNNPTEPEDDPEITLPEFECGEPFDLLEITNTTPLPSADTSDIFFIGGFPIKLKAVEGGAGSFSGIGIIPLPFSEKTVLVEFNSVQVNTDYFIYNGEVTAVADDIANYPEIPDEPFYIGGDICVPQTDEVGFDDDGIYQPTGEPWDPNGFGPTGTYIEQPPYTGYQPGDPFDPAYDPNGFGPDGTYMGTDSPFNPDGCNQQGFDIDGNVCNPAGDGPYWWLNEDPTSNPPTGGGIVAANSIDSVLMDYIILSLDSLTNEARDSMEAVAEVCDDYRGAIENILAQKEETEIVKGDQEQYLKKGMHQRFSNIPEILPPTGNNRDSSIIDLEQGHVDLYHCDKRYYKYFYWSGIISNAYAESNLNTCKSALLEMIRRLPDAQAETLVDDPAELLKWVYHQVDSKLYEELLEQYGEDYARQKEIKQIFNFDFGLPTPGILNSNFGSSVASRDALSNYADNLLEEMAFNFKQGHKYINGTHRAFFLESIASQRSAATTVSQTSSNLLPIVIDKVVAGKNQIVFIDNIVFTPSSAKMDLFFILDPGYNGNKAVFELQNVGFGPTGIPGSEDPKLVLVNDIGIRLNNAARLNIIGGENTYVAFDCDGFAGMSVEADIEFCREYLLPLKADMEVDPDDTKRVKAHFIVEMPAWGEFLAELSFDNFALAKAPDTKFTVQGAMLDLSDSQTLDGIVFPANYVSPFVQNNQPSPLWKGFYLKQLSVTLPNKFSEDDEPLTGGVKDVIIDGMGFSGEIFLKPVLALDKGKIGGWAISIDEFKLGVVANRIKSGELTGLINVPFLSSKENNSDEIKPEDCLSYTGTIDSENKYSFTVTTKQEYAAKMWKAEVAIVSGSSVGIKYINDEFVAEANLNGVLRVDGDFGGDKKLNIPDITFQNLGFQSKGPDYIKSVGTWSLPGEIGANFAGFGIAITNPGVSKTSGGDMSINFGVSLRLNEKENEPQNPDDPHLSADGSFSVVGTYGEVGGRQRFQYDRFKVNQFCLAAGGLKGIKSLSGCLTFFEESESSGGVNWGTGFRATLAAQFAFKKLEFGLGVVAQFGNIKTGDPYKYFMVDGLATFSEGIPLGPISLFGFGGGVTYHMERQNAVSSLDDVGNAPVVLPGLGESLSGVQYLPQKTIGLGIFANAVMGASNPKAFNFNATLGAEFNTSEAGGGFSKLYFQGNARFMSEMDITASCDYNANAVPNNGAAVNAYIDLQMDFNAGRFDGLFDVYINAADGGIVGSKDMNTGYFGGCEMSFGDEDGWYINLGKPSARNSLSVGIPGLKSGPRVNFTSYLNIGTQIEPMPDPPANVTSLTGVGNFMSNESTRATGRGFAFGASLDVDTGDRTFLIFYGSFAAGLGFDINIQDYGETTCTNTNGPIGINGWYGSGQLYGYFQGEVGIKVKWLGQQQEFPIIDLGAAAILQAKLPNPFWAKATVGGRYNILGGVFKGECRFQIQIGEACQFAGGGPDIPLSPIYIDITPGTNQFGVNTLVKPEITLGIPLDEEFSEGGSDYKIELDYVNIKKLSGEAVFFARTISEDKMSISLSPYYELPANDTLTLSVNIKVYKNGVFKSDETKEVTFYTGDALTVIPLTNLAESYPIFEQQNFHKAQSSGSQLSFGFIELETRMPSLINSTPEGKVKKIRLTKIEPQSVPKYYNIFTQNSPENIGKRITYFIPTGDIENGKSYRICLVHKSVPPNTGSGGGDPGTSQQGSNIIADNDTGFRGVSTSAYPERPYPRPYFVSVSNNEMRGGEYSRNPNNNLPADDILLEYTFRASDYSTFEEKMDAFMASGVDHPSNTSITNTTTEGFDQVELSGNNYNANLIEVEWVPEYNGDLWYNDVKSKFYNKIPYKGIGIERPSGVSEIPRWASFINANGFGLKHFKQVELDVSRFRTELMRFLRQNCNANSGTFIPEGDEAPVMDQCSISIALAYNNLPQWAKDFYDEIIPFPKFKAGQYKGIIKYKIPERPVYNYEFTLIK